MKLTNYLRQKFVKDFELPIPVVDSPYFEYFIDLYDESYDTKRKLKIFEDCLSAFKTEEEFLDYRYEVSNKIIEYIKSKEGYQKFVNEDFNKYKVIVNLPKCPIFKNYNVGKTLISIDLSSANFQALNAYDKAIFEANSYKEFIARFTDKPYFMESKRLRQVILGHLNGRIETYEKFLMSKILDVLKPYDYNIITFMNDEIVIEGNIDDYNQISSLLENIDIDVDIELFTLKALRLPDGGLVKQERFYVKDFIAYKKPKRVDFEIKATNTTIFSQFYKLVKKEEIVENDLVFINEGYIAFYKTKLSGEVY